MRVVAEGLEVGHGTVPVLRDLSFTVEPGRLVALIGVNGAGKSTLLQACAGLLQPMAGTVTIDGLAPAAMDRRTLARCLAYVPQHVAVGRQTVFEAVLLGRRPYLGWGPGSADLELAERTIERLGLGALAFRTVDTLSGGEAQRVHLARALAQTPRVMVLDEPTSDLDPRGQSDVMAVLRRTADDEGTTVMLSLHDINLALRWVDELLVLRGGRLVEHRRPTEVDGDVVARAYGIDAVVAEVAGWPVVVPTKGGSRCKGSSGS